MTNFDQALSRLKQTLGVTQDKDVAKLLGMSQKAFTARKRRGSFPEDKLLALVARRPDLAIDQCYVLTGDYRSVYEAKAILARNRIEEDAGVHYLVEPVHGADEAEVLNNYRNATDDGKAAIRATARAVQKIKNEGDA